MKLFPADSRQIYNEITRYYLVLQLRQDIFSGQLPCSFASAVYLASLIAQAEIGDFLEEEHTSTGEYHRYGMDNWNSYVYKQTK